MKEFSVLIGQLFFVYLAQTVVEVFFDENKRAIRLVNVACFLGQLYFVLQFAFNHILKEINTLVKMPF
ncbi:MAG: hypothetical protein LBC41_07015 [Clostridiales bacterium]|jgi:hypothetical protein|nr:hypothetical protein [Clostridiales bacterium]MDR2750391.1 hypothetical protein [Clostridiales bacterium]